jgi:hypothetical protein
MLRSPLYREIPDFMDTGIEGSVNIWDSLDFSFPCMASTNALANQAQNCQKMNSFRGRQRNEQDADTSRHQNAFTSAGKDVFSAKEFSMSWKGMYFFNSREIKGNSQTTA